MLRESAQAEEERRRVEFSHWLQLSEIKTTKRLAYSNSGALTRIDVYFPCVYLVIWNEAHSSLKILGFRRAKEVQQLVDVDHPLGVPPTAQVTIDATESLLQTLTRGRLDLSKIQGVHSVTVIIHYEKDSVPTQSTPSTAYVKGELRGTGKFSVAAVARRPFEP